MKHTKLLILFLLATASQTFAQQSHNPFAEYGYDTPLLTLSNGKYQEFHDFDTVITFGTVRYNTITKKVVDILPDDYKEDTTLQPKQEFTTRFLSIDPLTKEYPMLTPYQFASNTPIQAIDLDGLEAWFTPWIFASRPTPLIQPVTETIVKTSIEGFKWNSKLTTGENIANLYRTGRLNHFERQIEWAKEGFTIEKWLGRLNGKGNRTDGIKTEIGKDGIHRGFIRELKPNNKIGKESGYEQLNRYVEAAIKLYPEVAEWYPQLELYGQFITVNNGDNLSSIAQNYNTTVEKILKLNNIKDADKLKIGETLLINVGIATKENKKSDFPTDNTAVHKPTPAQILNINSSNVY